MHFLGLDGMPRRIVTYAGESGWEFWNAFATAGVIIIGLSIVAFVHNVFNTARNGKKVGNDPWDARTLEWSIPSPPPEYNFVEIPTVKDRDAFWEEKYSQGPDGRPIPKVQGAAEVAVEEKEHNIHMPTPSYYPHPPLHGHYPHRWRPGLPHLRQHHRWNPLAICYLQLVF